MIEKQLYKYKDCLNVKTTFDIGEITPVYWNILNPGEKVDYLNLKNLTRMIPPIYPTLDNPYIDLYAFSVPLRILYSSSGVDKSVNLEKERYNNVRYSLHTIYGESEISAVEFFQAPLDDKEFIGYKDSTSSFAVAKGASANLLNILPNSDSYKEFINSNSVVHNSNLLNKFGVDLIKYSDGSQGLNNSELKLEYLLAYWKIYNDFFKDKRVEIFNYNDFFNALTNFGKQLSLSVGTTYDEAQLNMNKALTLLNKIALTNTDNDILDDFTFEKVGINIGSDWRLFKKNIFNEYIKNRLILSKKNLGTYKDTLIEVWNTNNGDKTNVKLLGFERFNQTISQVINQSKNNSNQLGEVGGLSVTYNEFDNLIKNYEVNEPSIIMVLAVPNYKLTIAGYYDKDEWTKQVYGESFSGLIEGLKYDNFNPQMELIQVPFYDDWVYYRDGDEVDGDKLLGYRTPFEFMRNKVDIVCGEVQHKDKWGAWAYSISFRDKSLKDINTNILKINKKPFKDTLQNVEGDAFVAEFNFYTLIKRHIKPKNLIIEKFVDGE